ncbi:MAG: nickel pincer cofactor biosynthesis protein LarC [Thermoleophilia bacterium]|nr:nickel pincer cofactor biosynthesis protein LarC [Thermoleophilia bacterium]
MSTTILYIDPWSGISGDMLLAALLDCDRDGDRLADILRGAVDALRLEGARVDIRRDVEWGVACTRVVVDDGGAAPLRHLADMEQIIGNAALSEGVRRGAVGAVRRLAEVEASIHGCGVDEIHFHEVGAVDTIVDVVGAFVLVEALGVQTVMVGPVPVGGGTVEIAHGRMGVPAPATARLLEGYEVVGGPEMRELTTPTGALLIGQLGAVGGAIPPMRMTRVGHGAGCMKLEKGPNILRVMLGATQDGAMDATPADAGAVHVVELETNLDDSTPEIVGHTCEMLRRSGALDAWVVPAQMKKGRPGVILHALVEACQEAAATAIMFEETGTLGVRRRALSRHVADRGDVGVTVAGAQVRVKWGRWRDMLTSVAPEYDDAATVAAATGIPLKDVMEMAAEAARERLGWDRRGLGADVSHPNGE